MAYQTQQIFYCWFQNLVSGQSAACAEGEEAGTGLNGASLGILNNVNKQSFLTSLIKFKNHFRLRQHCFFFLISSETIL